MIKLDEAERLVYLQTEIVGIELNHHKAEYKCLDWIIDEGFAIQYIEWKSDLLRLGIMGRGNASDFKKFFAKN